MSLKPLPSYLPHPFILLPLLYLYSSHPAIRNAKGQAKRVIWRNIASSEWRRRYSRIMRRAKKEPPGHAVDHTDQIVLEVPHSAHKIKPFSYLHCCTVHFVESFNRLTPNDPYIGRTAPLTSKRCILYIYSTNIGTEYFKHALYSPFFFLFKMQFVS